MASPTLKFELSLEQANAILNILGNAPYVASAALIALLQEQAGPQVQAFQAEEKQNESETAAD